MTAEPSSEIGAAARSGAVTLVGSLTSAVLGFVLIVLVARLLGVAGSGVVLQAMAVFSIAMVLTRLGADTTAMWLLPRLRHEDSSTVSAGLFIVLMTAVAVPTAAVAAWFVLVGLRSGPVLGTEVDRAVSASAPFLPAAAVMVTALAATRSFGGVLPFNLVQNIGVPAGRILAVPVAVVLGGSAVVAAGAWAAVFLPAVVVAVAVLFRMTARTLPAGPRLVVPNRALLRRAAGFALPRTISSTAEQANLWLAVVLVGLVADAAAAGAYGTAARFVGAGVIIATAVRIAVAPRFSALLARGRHDDVAQLYTVSARWVLFFGTPIYLVLAANAATVLGWLGDGFEQATRSMVILCVGSVVMLAAGNVQSLLLMSGGSGRAAVNKVIAVVVLTAGTLILVPRVGIQGAAYAWTAATLLDTTLAAIQVRRATGISLDPWHVLGLLGLLAVAVAAPSTATALLVDDPLTALLASGLVAAVGLGMAGWAVRGQLHLDALVGVLHRR